MDGVLISRDIIPEFNKIHVIKELLNVKYNFAFVADIVFVWSHYVLNSLFIYLFYISMY